MLNLDKIILNKEETENGVMTIIKDEKNGGQFKLQVYDSRIPKMKKRRVDVHTIMTDEDFEAPDWLILEDYYLRLILMQLVAKWEGIIFNDGVEFEFTSANLSRVFLEEEFTPLVELIIKGMTKLYDKKGWNILPDQEEKKDEDEKKK